MKKILMGAAAALAIAAPAHAATGWIGASYNNGEAEPGSVSFDSWAVDGSVAFDAGGLGVTLDAGYADSEDSDSVVAGTAHLYMKGEKHTLGGFVGLADSNSNNVWDAGIEGQLFNEHSTLGAALTYARADDADVDAIGVNGAAKIFVTDNLAIGANAGWFQLSGSGPDGNAWVLGAGGEWQPESMPVSFLVGWNHYDTDDSSGVSANVFTVGARYNFGGTLKARNHSGADLAGLSGVSALRF